MDESTTVLICDEDHPIEFVEVRVSPDGTEQFRKVLFYGPKPGPTGIVEDDCPNLGE